MQVRLDRVSVGKRDIPGNDKLALFIRPRPCSDIASVGAIAPAGSPAMRLAQRIPYFISGMALPDFTVLSVDMLATEGTAGVRAAGFFAKDWSLDPTDLVINE